MRRVREEEIIIRTMDLTTSSGTLNPIILRLRMDTLTINGTTTMDITTLTTMIDAITMFSRIAITDLKKKDFMMIKRKITE